MANMMNWYLVYTKPACEELLSIRFANAGFEVLNPKIKIRKYYRKKLQVITEPLFPCYIFVNFNLHNDYRLVKYTRGVRRVIGTGYFPSVVPQEIVSEIQKRINDGVSIIEPQPFESGDAVVITSGPLEGLGAIFDKRLNGGERVSVLLKSMNSRAIVDSAALAKS